MAEPSTSQVDVVIVGSGTAGLAALREVRKHTERFLLVNDGVYCTTCARVGCMPSKALIAAANAFHERIKLQESVIGPRKQKVTPSPHTLQHPTDVGC
jgi:dihydrolipoamide dehydrogenase